MRLLGPLNQSIENNEVFLGRGSYIYVICSRLACESRNPAAFREERFTSIWHHLGSDRSKSGSYDPRRKAVTCCFHADPWPRAVRTVAITRRLFHYAPNLDARNDGGPNAKCE